MGITIQGCPCKITQIVSQPVDLDSVCNTATPFRSTPSAKYSTNAPCLQGWVRLSRHSDITAPPRPFGETRSSLLSSLLKSCCLPAGRRINAASSSLTCVADHQLHSHHIIIRSSWLRMQTAVHQSVPRAYTDWMTLQSLIHLGEHSNSNTHPQESQIYHPTPT